MIAAAWDALVTAAFLIAVGGLVWHVANAIECWRYLRSRERGGVPAPAGQERTE